MDTKTIERFDSKKGSKPGGEPRDALGNGGRENAKRKARKRRSLAPLHAPFHGRSAQRDAAVARRDKSLKTS
jgi:hypothetical protein